MSKEKEQVENPFENFNFLNKIFYFGYTFLERMVINMENKGVSCDVCECMHHVGSCKCNAPEIKVTKQATSNQAMDTPHFCQTYVKK